MVVPVEHVGVAVGAPGNVLRQIQADLFRGESVFAERGAPGAHVIADHPLATATRLGIILRATGADTERQRHAASRGERIGSQRFHWAAPGSNRRILLLYVSAM